MNDLLTVSDVAEWLGVCPATIRRYVKAGRLPVLAINQRLHRFLRSDVLTFVERHRAVRP